MMLFSLPSIPPALPTTSPSPCSRCLTVVLCFPCCSLHPHHTGSAFHSFKAIHHTHFFLVAVSPFLLTLLTLTLFGTTFDSSQTSTINYPFICSSGQPTFALSVYDPTESNTPLCAAIISILYSPREIHSSASL